MDDSKPPVVVFVHGLWMTGIELTWLRHRMEHEGFRTCRFSYPTVRKTLPENAEALFEFARGVDADELHFVAHSMGGLVTLNMLSRFHEQLPSGRVVLIGSPVRGSRAARTLSEYGWGQKLLGGAANGCLDSDHDPIWHGERDVGVIAGTRSVGLGRLVGVSAEAPNDGTVAVEETRLSNETDRLELPLTHVTLMFSSSVANAAAKFLRTGSFV